MNLITFHSVKTLSNITENKMINGGTNLIPMNCSWTFNFVILRFFPWTHAFAFPHFSTVELVSISTVDEIDKSCERFSAINLFRFVQADRYRSYSNILFIDWGIFFRVKTATISYFKYDWVYAYFNKIKIQPITHEKRFR